MGRISWRLATVLPEAPRASVYIDFLYKLLQERLKSPQFNLSHTTMPTFEEHVRFVYSRPYKNWWVIVHEHDHTQCMGSVYISKDNEIGIFLSHGLQGQGYGREVIEYLLETRKGMGLMLANINPSNSMSIRLFENLGFKLLGKMYSKYEYGNKNNPVFQLTYSKII